MASTAASKPLDSTTFAARLHSVTYAAKDALLFEFAALQDGFPPVQPGAHLDLHLPAGVQRQYSLVTPLCTDTRYVVAVKREHAGRGGSLWLHDEVRVGTELTIGRPRNNFGLDETAAETLLLAGGIGITPLYAMFMRMQALGRTVRLHYWTRSAEHALFLEQLRHHPDVALHYSGQPDRASVTDILRTTRRDTEIYCCGPVRMLDECCANAPDLSRVHIERFSNSVPESASDASADGFTVHLARQHRDIEVAAGETILGALLAAGVDVPYSCEEGVCGACETRVLEGSSVHRDSVRKPEDHARLGTIMICCSGAKSGRLVLDL